MLRAAIQYVMNICLYYLREHLKTYNFTNSYLHIVKLRKAVKSQLIFNTIMSSMNI